jgi:hypothetical protein
LTTALIYKKNFNGYKFHWEDLGISSLAGILAGIIMKKGGNKIFHKKIKNERLLNTLEMFIQKYVSQSVGFDENSLRPDYSKVIPKELIKTFDILSEEYQVYGKKRLQENAIDILKSIKSKIMHETKKEKYDAKEKKKKEKARVINERLFSAAAFATAGNNQQKVLIEHR